MLVELQRFVNGEWKLIKKYEDYEDAVPDLESLLRNNPRAQYRIHEEYAIV